MARLFVAVWPPEDVVADLMDLRRKDQRGVRFVPPENWHITLRFLGEADIGEVSAALDQAELPAARAHLGPGVDTLNDRAIVVPVDGVDDLAAAVTAATAQIGEAPRRRFVGHLTLARLGRHFGTPLPPRGSRRQPDPDRRPPELPPAIGALIGPIEFDVTGIALVRSRLHPDGARYETVDTWPTVAAPIDAGPQDQQQ